MKRIDLGKGYVIDIDSLNMTLKKDVRINTKTKIEVLEDGETKETQVEYEACSIVGYYSSLETILNAYYKEKVIEHLEEEQTLKKAIKVLRETKEMIKEQFEEIDFK